MKTTIKTVLFPQGNLSTSMMSCKHVFQTRCIVSVGVISTILMHWFNSVVLQQIIFVKLKTIHSILWRSCIYFNKSCKVTWNVFRVYRLIFFLLICFSSNEYFWNTRKNKKKILNLFDIKRHFSCSFTLVALIWCWTSIFPVLAFGDH